MPSMINHPLVQVFDEATRVQLLAQSRRVAFKKGDLLFLEGHVAEGVYFVESGMLKILKNSSSGIQTVFSLYSANSFVALSVLFNSPHTYPASGMCVIDAVVYEIPRQALQQAILSKPEAMMLWFGQLNRRLENIQQLLTDQIFTDSLGRFKKVMRYFVTLQGIKKGTYIEVEVPLSKQDLAEYIGVRRETLSRMFSQLKKEKSCYLNQKKWIIDPEWLKDELE